eukprot:5255133-Pyramimonas_sp.AAC.1
MGVDSCAAATVVPTGAAPDCPTCAKDMSAEGEGYRAANGGWVAAAGSSARSSPRPSASLSRAVLPKGRLGACRASRGPSST